MSAETHWGGKRVLRCAPHGAYTQSHRGRFLETVISTMRWMDEERDEREEWVEERGKRGKKSTIKMEGSHRETPHPAANGPSPRTAPTHAPPPHPPPHRARRGASPWGRQRGAGGVVARRGTGVSHTPCWTCLFPCTALAALSPPSLALVRGERGRSDCRGGKESE